MHSHPHRHHHADHDHGQAHGRPHDLHAHRDGDSEHAHRRVAPPSAALGWSLVVVLGFGIVEGGVGMLSGSLALVSDAVHMITDAVALAVAWWAQRIARRSPTETHSFGYERAEPLAAFANGLFYVGLLGFIAVEAVARLFAPEPIRATWALPVAVAGLLVNGVVWRMLHGERERINTRAALLHVIGDFAASAVAIVAIATAWLTGWMVVDPLLALAITAFMLVTSLGVLRSSARELMNAAPEGLALGEIAGVLLAVEGVDDVHDLHVWSIGSAKVALAAHLELDGSVGWDTVLESVRRAMRERYGIDHLTLQPESPLATAACGSR